MLIGLSVLAIVHTPPWCFVELMEKFLAMNKSPILQNVRLAGPCIGMAILSVRAKG